MRVMRLIEGETFEIVNGEGALATAELLQMSKEHTEVRLKEVTLKTPPSQHILLILPLMRPAKLEWIVEKATELGANALYFYAAEYSEKVQLSENQLERLHNLSLSALKQSGSLFLPSLEVLPSLERALSADKTYYFGDTKESARSILDAPLSSQTALITGPERGFSPKELTFLSQKAQGITLSKNILRAETAPLVGLSVLALKINT